MKPVMQTNTSPGSGECKRACLATILECSLEVIPDLTGEAKTLGEQIAKEDAFLEAHGLRSIRCHMTGGYESGDVFFVFPGYAIAWGKSPRGASQHAVVVGHDDGVLRIAHDPHPDQTGIDGEFTGIQWIFPKIPNSVPEE